VTSVLGDLHEQLGPFYSDIGRPSIDPELLIRMLIAISLTKSLDIALLACIRL